MAVEEPATDSGAASENARQLLVALGLTVEERWPWVSVGASRRQQGWKIHLSCAPLQLPVLINRLATIWRRMPFAFKIIGTVELAMLLNEGAFGDTQIGKCATVYPEDDEQFSMLVETFRAISDIVGPMVPDDVWLGGIVFARFGGFNPVIRRNILGQLEQLITDENGSVVPDQYSRDLTTARFEMRFAGHQVAAYHRPYQSVPKGIVNGRYLIVDVLRESGKGALLQAIDIQNKDAIRAVILKQARAHVLSDRNGHDIRDRLRHQERMHKRAAKLGIVPACDDYFEIDQDGYLPIVFQHNDNFEARVQMLLAGQTIDHCPKEIRATILATLDIVGALLEQLHGIGIVHRDISPSNILVRQDGQPLISDLEIAWEIGSQQPVYGKGTPGFMAPEQMVETLPEPANDVHAYAALILYSVTGMDPRRLPLPSRSDNWRSLATLGQSLSPALWSAIKSGLALDPADRPALSTLRTALQRDLREIGSQRADPAGVDIVGLLSAGVRTLASPALVEPASGIWLSASIKTGSQRGSRPEIHRSLNRGVAGPLYFCAYYARHFALPEEVRTLCETNGQWLIHNRTTTDYAMPGLHFGEAGVLLALYEARMSGLLSFDHQDVLHLWDAVLDHTPDWPDFTHGSAGISIGLGRLAELLCDDTGGLPFDLAAERHRQLSHLLATQNVDGSWTLPGGVNGLSGETVTGFAHGVAGIAYALAVAPATIGNTAYLEAAIRAADWLLNGAQVGPECSLSWPYSDRHKEQWNWWCHGGPGISQLFVALYSSTGRSDYRDAALNCFVGFPSGFNPANLSQCHGASGLAELLLDSGCALDCPELVCKAKEIANNISARHFRGARDIYWIVEDTDFVGADLMVGLSGVLHFLLRLASNESSLSFPTLVPM